MTVSQRSQAGVIFRSQTKAFNGYTLFTPLGECRTWLMDMEGNFVHKWESDLTPACYAKLLPNGNLLYSGKLIDTPLPDFGGIGGKLTEMTWDGKVVWEYEDPYMHHDFSRLPNGNTMILRFVETPPELVGKIKGGLPGTERDGIIWADSFQEITPAGEVVWEWLGYEHLLEREEFAICPLCSRAEWTHVNTCHVLPNGDILTSFLRQNTIGIIDRKTKELKWTWGRGGKLGHQHDPNMLENGNILVFDNGTHRSDSEEGELSYGMINFSRVLEINPESGEIVWEYKDESATNFHSPAISGAQRLPNGNTLICEGVPGRIFEVTPAKEVVWEYRYPFYVESPGRGMSNSIFRAYRYAPEHPALKGKDLNPRKVRLTLREAPHWREKLEKEKQRREMGQAEKADDKKSVFADRLKRLGY